MCQEKSIDCVFAGHLQFKTNCGAMAAITWQDKMRAMRGIIQGWGREEAVVRNHIARARARGSMQQVLSHRAGDKSCGAVRPMRMKRAIVQNGS